jgi:hypothetical protein
MSFWRIIYHKSDISFRLIVLCWTFGLNWIFFSCANNVTWDEKGAECPFRHCEAARKNTFTCKYWIKNECQIEDCPFRHPKLKPEPSATPCYFFSIGACKNGANCPFLHETVSNVQLVKEMERPVKDTKEEVVERVKDMKQAVKDTKQAVKDMEQTTASKTSQKTPVTDSTNNNNRDTNKQETKRKKIKRPNLLDSSTSSDNEPLEAKEETRSNTKVGQDNILNEKPRGTENNQTTLNTKPTVNRVSTKKSSEKTASTPKVEKQQQIYEKLTISDSKTSASSVPAKQITGTKRARLEEEAELPSKKEKASMNSQKYSAFDDDLEEYEKLFS